MTERELVQIENITKVRFAFDLRESSEMGKVISQTFRLFALTRSSVRHPDQLHLLSKDYYFRAETQQARPYSFCEVASVTPVRLTSIALT